MIVLNVYKNLNNRNLFHHHQVTVFNLIVTNGCMTLSK